MGQRRYARKHIGGVLSGRDPAELWEFLVDRRVANHYLNFIKRE